MRVSKKVTEDVWMQVSDIKRESSISSTDINNQFYTPLTRIVMTEVWLNISDELLNPFKL